LTFQKVLLEAIRNGALEIVKRLLVDERLDTNRRAFVIVSRNRTSHNYWHALPAEVAIDFARYDMLELLMSRREFEPSVDSNALLRALCGLPCFLYSRERREGEPTVKPTPDMRSVRFAIAMQKSGAPNWQHVPGAGDIHRLDRWFRCGSLVDSTYTRPGEDEDDDDDDDDDDDHKRAKNNPATTADLLRFVERLLLDERFDATGGVGECAASGTLSEILRELCVGTSMEPDTALVNECGDMARRCDDVRRAARLQLVLLLLSHAACNPNAAADELELRLAGNRDSVEASGFDNESDSASRSNDNDEEDCAILRVLQSDYRRVAANH
jgi:hypothetical protein